MPYACVLVRSVINSCPGVGATTGNSLYQLGAERTLSVIVPVLNELRSLPGLVTHLNEIGAEELIIVDGGSADGSLQWLRQYWEDAALGHIVIASSPGRASQMNAAAQVAQGDLLLFLHADTRLPVGARREVLDARERQCLWGRFDAAFETVQANRLIMQLIALFMNIRSRLTSIATGDQGIFVDRVLFETIGGFADIPIMEDIALSKILRRHCVAHCSRLRVTTSARRWEQHGIVRTVLLMWYLRLAYFLGASPHRLAEQYRHTQ